MAIESWNRIQKRNQSYSAFFLLSSPRRLSTVVKKNMPVIRIKRVPKLCLLHTNKDIEVTENDKHKTNWISLLYN